MKKDIHPDHRPVLFIDQAAPAPNNWMLISSTVNTKEKGVCPGDGKEYPLVKVSISSFTHRLWTGAVQFLDAEGRLEKFANKFKRKAEHVLAEIVKEEEALKEKAKATKKKK